MKRRELVGEGEQTLGEALTAAIRSIAFIVPAGLAAQEGGFILIGQMLGLDGSTALALGLIRRVREILLGVPGLIVWWCIETHRAGGHRPA